MGQNKYNQLDEEGNKIVFDRATNVQKNAYTKTKRFGFPAKEETKKRNVCAKCKKLKHNNDILPAFQRFNRHLFEKPHANWS